MGDNGSSRVQPSKEIHVEHIKIKGNKGWNVSLKDYKNKHQKLREYVSPHQLLDLTLLCQEAKKDSLLKNSAAHYSEGLRGAFSLFIKNVWNAPLTTVTLTKKNEVVARIFPTI